MSFDHSILQSSVRPCTSRELSCLASSGSNTFYTPFRLFRQLSSVQFDPCFHFIWVWFLYREDPSLRWNLSLSTMPCAPVEFSIATPSPMKPYLVCLHTRIASASDNTKVYIICKTDDKFNCTSKKSAYLHLAISQNDFNAIFIYIFWLHT